MALNILNANIPTAHPVKQRAWVQELTQKHAVRKRRENAELKRLQRRLTTPNQNDMDGIGSMSTVIHEKLLHRNLLRQRSTEQLDLGRLDLVAGKLLTLSSELDADVSLVARTAAVEGKLLLLPPAEVKQRLMAVKQQQARKVAKQHVCVHCLQSLGLPSLHEALQLAARDPALLSRPAATLQQAIKSLSAVFKSRGLPPLRVLAAKRPDILRSSPAVLAEKLDTLPVVFRGLPQQAMHDLLLACPGILRRSPHAVEQRVQMLTSLLPKLPPSVVISEILLLAPELMELSPALLSAKFETLKNKLGADVDNFLLVEPTSLLAAEPTWPPAKQQIKTPVGQANLDHVSNKKQRTLFQQPDEASTAQQDDKHMRDAQGNNTEGGSAVTTDSNASSTDGSTSADVTAESQLKAGTQKRAKRQWPSPIDQLLATSARIGVPLFDVLQMYATPAGLPPTTDIETDSLAHASSTAEALAQQPTKTGKHTQLKLPHSFFQLAILLGLPLSEVKLLVGRAPGILLVPTEQIKARLEELTVLLKGSETTTNHVADSSSQHSMPSYQQNREQHSTTTDSAQQEKQTRKPRVSPEVLSLLHRQPELLQEAPGGMQARIQILQQCLSMPHPRVMAMLVKQPRVLLIPPEQLQHQLQALRNALGGVSAGVMGELLARETGLLDAPVARVAARFEDIAARFGSFTEDAIGVVLADPSVLLQDESAARQGVTGGSPAARDGFKASARQQHNRQRSDASKQSQPQPSAGRGSKRSAKHSESSEKGSNDSAAAAAAAALDAMVLAEQNAAKANAEAVRVRRKEQRARRQQT